MNGLYNFSPIWIPLCEFRNHLINIINPLETCNDQLIYNQIPQSYQGSIICVNDNILVILLAIFQNFFAVALKFSCQNSEVSFYFTYHNTKLSLCQPTHQSVFPCFIITSKFWTFFRFLSAARGFHWADDPV